MKRGQTEILGLAIVIILLLLVFMFVAKYIIPSKKPDYKQQYKESQLSTNMIHSILETSANCSNLYVKELLQDCEGPRAVYCNGAGSCDKSREIIGYILNKTLDEWNEEYEFRAFVGNDCLSPQVYLFDQLGNCSHSDRKSQCFPIKGISRVIYLRLDLCS